MRPYVPIYNNLLLVADAAFHLTMYYVLIQVTDVTSADFRCYNTAVNASALTATVAAGSSIGFQANGAVYHPGVCIKQITVTESEVLQ